MIPYSANRAGVVWGKQDPRLQYAEYDDRTKQRLFNFVGVVGGIGAAGFFAYRGFYRRADESAVTGVFRMLQDIERFTPFQIMSTFRFSSIMSPLAQAEKIAPAHVKDGMIKLSRDFLGEHTVSYLSKITGQSPGLLATKLVGDHFYWQRTPGRYTGRLIQKTSVGAERIIADNIGLLYTGGSGGYATKKVNRFAQAYLSVIDEDIAHALQGTSKGQYKTVEEAVEFLYDKERRLKVKAGLPFIPIGPGSDWFSQKTQAIFSGKDYENIAQRGLTALQHARAVPAFASARLNDLVKQLTEPFPALQRVLTIKEGTFLKNQVRYAGKAGMVVGAWALLQNADWLKRRDSIVGEAGAAGSYGFGAGFLARKVFGASPKTAMLAGVASAALSFTPPFEEGAVPGLATVATRLNLFRAHITHAPGIKYLPFIGSEYKDLLERAMPGSTSGSSVMMGGLVLTAAFNWRHFKKIQTWKANVKELGWSVNPFEAPTDPSIKRVYDQLPWWKRGGKWARAVGEGLDKTRTSLDYDVLPEHIRAQRELNEKLAKDLLETKGFFSRFKMQAKGALKGASGDATRYIEMLSGSRKAPMGLIGQGVLRFAIPAALAFVGLGGLATSETPEELQDLYEGRQYVPVRKGRWWEMGGCFHPETLIATGYGDFRAAHDMEEWDTLVASDGTICDVNQVFTREYAGRVLAFTTWSDRATPTVLTPNHIVPVLKVYRDRHLNKLTEPKAVEVDADTVCKWDFVQVAIPELPQWTRQIETLLYIDTKLFIEQDGRLYPAQTNWLTKKIQRSNGASIPSIIQLTEDFGRLLGYFLAEGNLSFKNDKPHIIETVHAKDERFIVDDIIEICKSIFGIAPTVRFKKTGKLAKEGCWIVRICSSLLADMFFGLFYDSTRTQDKFIRPLFLEACNDFKRGVVEGYWRGDGHLDSDRRLISSSRMSFVYKMRQILFSLGFLPSVAIEERQLYADKYILGWRPDLTYKDKQKGFIYHNDKLYAKVVHIEEELYDGIVYDFEIDHKDHLLEAGGFVVHNSPYEGTSIRYWKPHWYRTLTTRAKHKALWGADEDQYNPIQKFLLEEFTYELERKNYYSRPYPITDQAFADVPFVGWLLSPTIGRLIKPARLMHQEDLVRVNDRGVTEVADMRSSIASNPVGYLGGMEPQTPVSPFSGP
ncbi:MAG: hypothetical protein ACXABY_08040, partial [Candidatus Thorarchaeota archaeon]